MFRWSIAVSLPEELFTVQEVAKLWKLSPKKIRQLFADEVGVLRIGNEEKTHGRAYISLRIPASVERRVKAKLAA